MLRRLLLPVLAVAACAACADPSSPSRADFYDWRLGGTQLTFHWPHDRLPVRIWVQDAFGLPGHVADGIQLWKDQFLYGEWDAVVVADSSTADIKVFSTVVPIPKPIRAFVLHSSAPECGGDTGAEDLVGSTLVLPIIIYVTPLVADPTTPAAQRCLGLTVAHELGHAMGLLQHSPDPDDLMYAQPDVEAPSLRDRNTVENLYHFPSDLVPSTR